ncbi:hypothetical protein ADUPG1_004975 [Aduncisulcus paluster]|uniref:Uncharacterized protein n=1 Tax=Aduncisulcus paluster TaxID=2918883 RepID=A0ABQ5K7M5_9EUKA|nr:hypothetical protein ADUPG1_004975 [Aduncisulcus paluster]
MISLTNFYTTTVKEWDLCPKSTQQIIQTKLGSINIDPRDTLGQDRSHLGIEANTLLHKVVIIIPLLHKVDTITPLRHKEDTRDPPEHQEDTDHLDLLYNQGQPMIKS